MSVGIYKLQIWKMNNLNGNPRVDLGRDQESRSHERGWLVKDLIIHNNPNASIWGLEEPSGPIQHWVDLKMPCALRTFWEMAGLGFGEDGLYGKIYNKKKEQRVVAVI